MKAKEQPLKILWFAPRYVPLMAGGETYVAGFARHLSRMGHQIGVVTATRRDGVLAKVVDEEGIQCYRGVPHHLGPVAPILDDFKPDVVLVQFEWCDRVIEASDVKGLPVGIVCHGPWSWIHGATDLGKKKTDFFIFNSIDSLLYADLRPMPHHAILYPPLDIERVTINRQHNRERITLVNAIAEKGVFLLEALARMMPEKDFLLVKGGYGQQVPVNLPNVETIPNGDIRAALARTRILLMPSHAESFGMAAIEAQWNSIPVVASDLDSLRESLGPSTAFCRNTVGFAPNAVNAEELDGWAQAITRLDSDPEYYRRQCQAAKANAARFVGLNLEQLGVLVAVMRQTCRTKPLMLQNGKTLARKETMAQAELEGRLKRMGKLP
jgi:glycosyltransferase involved in cell wall biosynthesis